MKSNRSWRSKLVQILVGAAMLIALLTARGAKADGDHEHLVTDWSHRHLVYSTPHSPVKRFELSRDRRYVDQWRRREFEKRHGGRNEWRWRRAPEGTKGIQGDWSMDMGAGATVGAGNYPAKFSFTTTSANCVTPAPLPGQQPDFVVYNTSLAGSDTQATIAAFSNLYSGCTGGTPQTYWAYNTGTTGAVVTSPVLSLDGTQVAFIQNVGGVSALVVLRWKAGSGTLSAPVVPSVGPCTALTAPCQQTVLFSTANADTTPLDSISSPFYDYGEDVLYVGDNLGFLHKFTGVFFGVPTEVVSTGPSTLWPANLTGTFGRLTSPILVSSLHEVIVSATDGVVYSVDTTIGGVTPSGFSGIDPKLADLGFDDAPLVDVTTGKIYLFARASSGFVVPTGVASVFQIPLPAVPADIHDAPITQIQVSDSATTPASAFYIGAFTNDYYNSSDGTGDLIVCSTSGTVTALWDVPVTAGVINSSSVGPSLSTANAACSPIAEFFDGTTDRFFLSVSGSAVTTPPINCPSNTTGCIVFFDLTNLGFWDPTTPATAATASVTGGTSGIVIDNSSTDVGASQVYFTPLADQVCTTSGGTGGCAIQASQSALH